MPPKKKTKTERCFDRFRVGDKVFVTLAAYRIPEHFITAQDNLPRVVKVTIAEKKHVGGNFMSFTFKFGSTKRYISQVRLIDISRKELVLRQRVARRLKLIRAKHNKEIQRVETVLLEYDDA